MKSSARRYFFPASVPRIVIRTLLDESMFDGIVEIIHYRRLITPRAPDHIREDAGTYSMITSTRRDVSNNDNHRAKNHSERSKSSREHKSRTAPSHNGFAYGPETPSGALNIKCVDAIAHSLKGSTVRRRS